MSDNSNISDFLGTYVDYIKEQVGGIIGDFKKKYSTDEVIKIVQAATDLMKADSMYFTSIQLCEMRDVLSCIPDNSREVEDVSVALNNISESITTLSEVMEASSDE
jgi:hypothetical protein